MPIAKYEPSDDVKEQAVYTGPKVSSGAAAVGATFGAVVGFVMPFPGAVAIGAAAGGIAGKFLGEKLSDD